MADLYPEAKREKPQKQNNSPSCTGERERERKKKQLLMPHANIKYQISAKITDDADPGTGGKEFYEWLFYDEHKRIT